MKQYSSALHRAIAAIVTIAAFCLFANISVSAAESDSKIQIIDAQIKSTSGVKGESTVDFVDDTVYPRLGTFTMPGAYAEMELKVKNTGTLESHLVDVRISDCTIEDFHVFLADDLQGETLKPNEVCTITAVVAWDKNSTVSFDSVENGDFSFSLLYEADEIPDVTQPASEYETSPPTTTAEATAAVTSVPKPNNQNPTSAIKSSATVDTSVNSTDAGTAIATGALRVFPIILLAVAALIYMIFRRKTKEDN